MCAVEVTHEEFIKSSRVQRGVAATPRSLRPLAPFQATEQGLIAWPLASRETHSMCAARSRRRPEQRTVHSMRPDYIL